MVSSVQSGAFMPRRLASRFTYMNRRSRKPAPHAAAKATSIIKGSGSLALKKWAKTAIAWPMTISPAAR